MSTQTLTIELPDGIFSRLKNRAGEPTEPSRRNLLDVLARDPRRRASRQPC